MVATVTPLLTPWNDKGDVYCLPFGVYYWLPLVLHRTLDLHHSAEAYRILHVLLVERLPANHSWLTRPTQPSKCFLGMRLAEMDRFHLHAPFPNLVLWRGDEVQSHDDVELDTVPYLSNVPRWGKIEG
ncbi:hypothetical protein BDZ89DRAFT_1133364 [Hymenopellis radicata]|nr:hypothetical protein BDZ89DRAFT_1133364 [Hymenopellis radicata]